MLAPVLACSLRAKLPRAAGDRPLLQQYSPAAHWVHFHGKGREQRAVPLWKSTAQQIRAWLGRNPALARDAPLLPNREARAMTRQHVNQRFDVAATRATQTHSSLTGRYVSPQTVRHSTARHMLQSGVAFSVIALWMGHASTTTTHRYAEADLAMKEQALARLEQPDTIYRYRPPDALRALPEAL
jgi:site-specific recombinase XerD